MVPEIELVLSAEFNPVSHDPVIALQKEDAASVYARFRQLLVAAVLPRDVSESRVVYPRDALAMCHGLPGKSIRGNRRRLTVDGQCVMRD